MANSLSAPLHLVPDPIAYHAPQEAGLRLTRRGKFVLIAMPIFMASMGVLMLLGLFLSPAKASADVPVGVAALSVTVIEGDTLWGLAQVAPQLDPREAVRQIAEINNLEGDVLYAGTELYIPTAR